MAPQAAQRPQARDGGHGGCLAREAAVRPLRVSFGIDLTHDKHDKREILPCPDIGEQEIRLWLKVGNHFLHDGKPNGNCQPEVERFCLGKVTPTNRRVLLGCTGEKRRVPLRNGSWALWRIVSSTKWVPHLLELVTAPDIGFAGFGSAKWVEPIVCEPGFTYQHYFQPATGQCFLGGRPTHGIEQLDSLKTSVVLPICTLWASKAGLRWAQTAKLSNRFAFGKNISFPDIFVYVKAIQTWQLFDPSFSFSLLEAPDAVVK